MVFYYTIGGAFFYCPFLLDLFKCKDGVRWFKMYALYVLRRLRSANKGAAFGIRKPLKRLERNFEYPGFL